MINLLTIKRRHDDQQRRSYVASFWPMLSDQVGSSVLGHIVSGATYWYLCGRPHKYQNAKQEAFWGRVEGRLMAMLEGEPGLTLDTLNRATQAWVEQEYHRSTHSELAATPLARYLEGPTVARPCPDAAALRAAFRIEVARRQRRADGTVSLAGIRLEIV